MRQGKYRRRCSTCGVRLATGQSRCVIPGHDAFVWQATVDVNAPGAKRKAATKSFPTRKEAVEWVAERQLTVKAGTFVEPHKLTVGAYLDRWFVATADLKGWEENTRRDYLGSIERLIKPRLGDLLLRSLTTDDVGGVYAELLREGPEGGGG